MAEFWESNLIYKVIAGSQAYGLARPESDVDVRGVCIPPKAYLLGLREFEQYENETHDLVIFALKKFVRLALGCNPNIIEMLFTAPEHVLFINALGERLRASRELFLTKQAGETFSRYAIAQLRRIERHHRWIIAPPSAPPVPEDFGGRPHRGRLKFPDQDAERAYHAAHKHWEHYEKWRRERNPARAELEARFGYDTKHAMHLMRLLRMGREILSEGEVRVQRPDAEWLKRVREGLLSYEELLALAKQAEAELAELQQRSTLPDAPEVAAAEALVVELHEQFLRANAQTGTKPAE
jgi:predicted nucleotidyltransferase